MEAWTEKQKREDVRLAHLMFSIYSSQGAKKKGGGRISLDDFLPEYCKPKKTAQEKEEKLKSLFQALAKRNPQK